MRFADRTEAGQRLARSLEHHKSSDVVVLGLPRGGVPVACEVAIALSAPLDVIVVRKLGVPAQPELAMGAIGEGGIRVANADVIRRGGITAGEIALVEQRERANLVQQAQAFRAGREPLNLAGRTAIIVDDGIATGSTAAAACQVARQLGAARVVLGAPVGAASSLDALASVCDEVVCLRVPDVFLAVGAFYDDFGNVPDATVARLLSQANAGQEQQPVRFSTQTSDASRAPPQRDEPVLIRAAGVSLPGQLTVPWRAPGTVIFVHGSGSSRHSPRNQQVAAGLNAAGFGTLLFDLLTPDEEPDRSAAFDIETLAARLTDVTAWLRAREPGPAGYFGASTGAAAALWAAAAPDAKIAAIVSRGGRPDLAGDRLTSVRAPTLLIVGERDDAVLGLNQQAAGLLASESRLSVVPAAGHLFSEPGAMAAVTALASDWFARKLV